MMVEQHTAQRIHGAFGRTNILLNWCVTPRMGADILVEAMPVVVVQLFTSSELEAEVYEKR
jgi:hypothetical protein